MTPEDAFLNSAESITGQITKKISTRGIKAVYDDMNADDKKIFETAYSASYSPSKEILQECYDEVRCGNEIRSVIMQGDRVNSGKGFIGKVRREEASRRTFQAISLTHHFVRSSTSNQITHSYYSDRRNRHLAGRGEGPRQQGRRQNPPEPLHRRRLRRHHDGPD